MLWEISYYPQYGQHDNNLNYKNIISCIKVIMNLYHIKDAEKWCLEDRGVSCTLPFTLKDTDRKWCCCYERSLWWLCIYQKWGLVSVGAVALSHQTTDIRKHCICHLSCYCKMKWKWTFWAFLDSHSLFWTHGTFWIGVSDWCTAINIHVRVLFNKVVLAGNT